MRRTIIIGSGISSLVCALSLSSEEEVLIITKGDINKSSSVLAQGGIAATLSKDKSEIDSHIEDTLYAGSNFNDKDMVTELVTNSISAIDFLESQGVKFDKQDNNFLLTKEGGHKSNRILRAGKDITGKVMMDSLIESVLSKKNIKVMENSSVVELLKKEDKCTGVMIIDDSNDVFEINATNVVIATGGIGGVYKHSTNYDLNTGDGIAMAYRIGASVERMEFVQFHPTSFYPSKGNRKFLISEALRGEGGILKNIEGKPFMKKYHKMKDLAPRDIVSQSIFNEMYDTWSDFVYLDMSHLDSEFVKNRFPNIYKNCLEYDIDITKDLIPITPVEHYMVGGIKADINSKTNIEGLYAIGECASNRVHGANRLASNSLLECVVFSMNAAKAINLCTKTIEKEIKEYGCSKKTYNYNKIQSDIKELMTRNLGVLRKGKRIDFSLDIFKEKMEQLKKHKIITKKYYDTLNISTIAFLIAESASKRKESLGCHFVLGEKNEN